MKVEIISFTPNPIEMMYLAAKRCDTFGDLHVDDSEKMERVVRKCLTSGNLTIAEFVDFTFNIEGITRYSSYQLALQRNASFCQMSERMVVLGTDDDEYYLEQEYAGMGGGCCSVETEAEESFNKLFGDVPVDGKQDVALSFLDYRRLIKNGVPVEQAWAVLPQCTKTKLLMHVNLRSLIEMAKLKLCVKTEEEIKKLFWNIQREVSKIGKEPGALKYGMESAGEIMASYIVPKCCTLERCNEESTCYLFEPIYNSQNFGSDKKKLSE